jgi:hypothetical protein
MFTVPVFTNTCKECLRLWLDVWEPKMCFYCGTKEIQSSMIFVDKHAWELKCEEEEDGIE